MYVKFTLYKERQLEIILSKMSGLQSKEAAETEIVETPLNCGKHKIVETPLNCGKHKIVETPLNCGKHGKPYRIVRMKAEDPNINGATPSEAKHCEAPPYGATPYGFIRGALGLPFGDGNDDDDDDDDDITDWFLQTAAKMMKPQDSDWFMHEATRIMKMTPQEVTDICEMQKMMKD